MHETSEDKLCLPETKLAPAVRGRWNGEMDPGTQRKIEIFAPCSAAFDLTKLILFQPFDLSKWLVIGFAAFLSHFAAGGAHFNYTHNSPFGKGNWNVRSTTHDAIQSASGLPGWVIPLIIIGGLILLVMALGLMWIGSRGNFIFTDCVVRNRGRIVEPWHEFKKEGNSYFLFTLLIWLGALVVLGLASAPLWLPFVLRGDMPQGMTLVLGLMLLGVVGLPLLVVTGLISGFMVPIMYRRRCGAAEALRAVLAMIGAHLGPITLYLLFSLVLWIAFAMVACLTTCLTCCLAAIPYVGTVILLPAYVFFLSYRLLFVRQFGPGFDVWAGIVAAEPVPPSIEPPRIEPPPLQT